MPRHTLLPVVIVLMLCPSGSSLAADAQPTTRPKVQKIDVEQFDRMRQEKNTVVLDVRTPDEFKKGHVPDALNINVDDPSFARKVSVLDRSKIYLVHCARGIRSARASGKLAKIGFEHLYDFAGGFDRWKEAGKPIEK